MKSDARCYSFVFIALLVSASPLLAQSWKLAWSDEFNRSGAPDPEKWTYEEGFIRNNESQYYTRNRRENARVENGMLVIESRKEAFANARYREGAGGRRGQKVAEYTSASLTTRGIQAWCYGKIEVRAKLPGGRGTWPAIWMLGEDQSKGWPRCGEIDIMEYVGFEPGVVHGTVHTGKYNHVKHTQKGNRVEKKGVENRFHVYSVEWTPEKIDFFLDGEKYFTFDNEHTDEEAWPFDRPHYLIINTAIGGGWGGQKGIDEDIFPTEFQIDYVRVYQKPE